MDLTGLRYFGPGPAAPWDPLAVVPRSAAKVEDGHIRHLEAHLARLKDAAEAAGTPCPWILDQAAPLAAWVAGEAEGSPDLALRLRLHGAALGALLEPLPETPSPYRLQLQPHPLGGPGAHPLAAHKGLTGAWGQEAVLRARTAGADDALLAWPDGTLAETGLAGIALEVDGELWIPPPEGRVASLAERLDLPAWAGSRPLRVRAFRVEDLAWGRLWCFNALRGVWPGHLT
ncbi:MAG TPA: aminotransferase class IV [Holophagaceae bacterium]|nr:aminotransferase class IV [Holophagaceae bacterium]